MGFVCVVLARIGAEAEEDKATRVDWSAAGVHFADIRRGLPALLLADRFWVSLDILRAAHAGGAVDRRSDHGGGTGVRGLGSRASGNELERHCHAEGRTRTDPDRAVPEC